MVKSKINRKSVLLCGLLGCFCFGGGDWLMLPPYFYWAYLLLRGKSQFSKWMAVSNPLVFYGILKAFTLLMPDDAFRLAFTNGLMSEGMALWFVSMLVWGRKK